MNDDFFNYLVATDTLDDFLGSERIDVYNSEYGSYLKMNVVGKYKYLGGFNNNDLTKNQIYYRVYRFDDPKGFYIVDNSGEDYLYPYNYFEKIE